MKPPRTADSRLPRNRTSDDEPLAQLIGGDLKVPLVQGDTVRYANLDVAASAPALRVVADHLQEVMPHYASIHRGAGYLSMVSTALYESARTTVGEFLGARPDDVVVFTRNTTDALNLLSRCVPPDGQTLVLDIEHHANLLPWQSRRHQTLRAGSTMAATIRAFERYLARRPTALVSITGASHVTGELLPVHEVVAICHRYGARVALDAAQLAPHRRIDMTALDVDYVGVSGHKLYAPYGAGALIGRGDWLDAGSPHLAGGGAVRDVSLERTLWAAGPQRHEAGTPNVLGVAALAKACETIGALLGGPLEDHDTRLRHRLTERLRRLPQVTVHRMWPDSDDSIGLVTFSVEGQQAGRVAACLSAEHGIAVRDGRFCAHPLTARLGMPSDGAVRASFGVGTTAEDIDRLAAAVELLVRRGPQWDYRRVDGRWTPTPDPRPLPPWALPARPRPVADAGVPGASPCEAGAA